MTSWTTLPDTTLAQDKPVTQSVMRALRDNPVAIGEAAPSAPRSAAASIDSPYFLASRATAQINLGSSGIKVQCNIEDYDPDSLYDASTYRFTPNKPGLYFVGAYLEGTNGGTANVRICSDLRKNGSTFALTRGAEAAANRPVSVQSGVIVQMNGTTDFLESFVFFAGDVSGACSLSAARFWAYQLCEA